MADVQYIGKDEKALIDVAYLTPGATFTVDDAFATRLLTAHPDQYILVDASEPSTKKAKTAARESIDVPVTIDDVTESHTANDDAATTPSE